MSNPDILFRGIPRGRTRGYTAGVLRALGPEAVVIPCTGSFSLAVTSVAAGVAPDKITCGDISIYSTALGHAIMGQPWHVSVVGDGRVQDLVRSLVESQDPTEQAVGVLYALRALQYLGMPQRAHVNDHVEEIVGRAAAYQGQIRAKLAGLRDRLHGLTYRARDMWETLSEYQDEPSCVLLVNPPRYDAGYAKMFKGVEAVLAWDAPAVAQFTEADYKKLMEQLGERNALALLYYATPSTDEDPADLWGPPWRSVFADKPGTSAMAAVNWIVANRDQPSRISRARNAAPGEGTFRLFDGAPGPESELTLRFVTKEVGEYYRDLFVHRLATGSSEKYVALLIDGCLLAVVGIHLKDFRIGKDCPFISFAFTVPHQNARLAKLTLMSLTSSWFWSRFGSFVTVRQVTRVRTVMLTKHPENKTARGVLKRTSSEKMNDDQYKLHYEGAVVTRNQKETVTEWLTKFQKS